MKTNKLIPSSEALLKHYEFLYNAVQNKEFVPSLVKREILVLHEIYKELVGEYYPFAIKDHKSQNMFIIDLYEKYKISKKDD